MKKKPAVQQILADSRARNHLYRGDCFDVLDRIPDESVDLVYIDPPFYSQRYYEKIWGEDGAGRYAFEDRWKGGIDTYINYLIARIRKLHLKLKASGLMYVHLDWHICHYMKVEMDKVFGYKRFLNEIIWYYKTGGMSKRWFGRKHDNIMLYSKTEDYFFNPLKEKSYLAHKYGFANIEVKQDDGGYYTMVGMRDVWDLPALRGNQPETLGYPTQKPLVLLDRIIRAGCPEHGVVLDAFCGCGTTLEAAQMLGRNWIGIDISQSALTVVANRLRKIGAPPSEIHGMVDSEKVLHQLTWQEFQAWAVDAIQGRHSPKKVADMGIDGFTFMENHPIQVKQMTSVGRPVIDNFVGVLERQKDKRGIIIAFDFTKGAVGEVARILRENKMEIELITCKQLLEEEIPFRSLA